MGKGRFRPQQKQDTGKNLRINDLIRISPIRLIDENNEQVGIIETDDAKRRAREAGLDLVEVAPTAKPPVCRIMDYGKWKYQQRKKEQKAKSHAKQSELKGIRLRPAIDEHDLEIKVNKARDFLDDGDKVQFTMLFRGRQMAHQDLGIQTMEQIYQRLSDTAKVEAAPKMQGRRMTMTLSPDKRTPGKSKGQQGENQSEREGESTRANEGGSSNAPPQPEPTGSAQQSSE